MSSIRSDVIVLPPNTAVKSLNSMRNVATGAAASTSLWEYPNINIVSSTDATPIVVNVGSGHGFLVGDDVTITGHTTNVGANGRWLISAVDATHVTLAGSVGSGAGAGGASGTINFTPGIIVPKTKCWVTFEAITEDVYVRIGAAASAGTTTSNGLLIPAGTAVAFYLTPSVHTNVDAYAPGGAGVLKWYVSSPPCERERI